MSSAATADDVFNVPQPKANIGKSHAGQNSDASYEDESMPPRHTGDLEGDVGLAILTELRAMRDESKAKNGKLNGWTQPLVSGLGTGAVILVAMFGIKFIPASTSEADRRADKLEFRTEQVETRAKEEGRELRLMEQYNRDLYIWFTEHGVKNVPQPPDLTKDK